MMCRVFLYYCSSYHEVSLRTRLESRLFYMLGVCFSFLIYSIKLLYGWFRIFHYLRLSLFVSPSILLQRLHLHSPNDSVWNLWLLGVVDGTCSLWTFSKATHTSNVEESYYELYYITMGGIVAFPMGKLRAGNGIGLFLSWSFFKLNHYKIIRSQSNCI